MSINRQDAAVVARIIALIEISYLEKSRYGIKKQAAKLCFDHFGADRIITPQTAADFEIVNRLKYGIKNAVLTDHSNRDQVWYYFKKDIRGFSNLKSSCGRKSNLQSRGRRKQAAVPGP